MNLEHADTLLLRSAMGWLELGSPAEALAELDSLSAQAKDQVEALEMRWLALAELKRWEPATRVARQLIEAAPDHANGWLHRSYALRRSSAEGLKLAYEALFPVAGKFPKEPIIPYNLACYSCQLKLDASETMAWLNQAMAAGQKQDIIDMALKDPDLSPLWPEIALLSRKR